MSEDAQVEEPAEGPTPELEVTTEDLLALLGSVPERLADLVAGLDEERLRYRHGPAFPTLGEVIGHLAAAGAALEVLLTAACLETAEPPEATTVLEAPTPAELDRPLGELLDDARRVRRRSVDLLRGLPKDGWSRTVPDARRGGTTLAELVDAVLRHELGHLSQLRNLAAFFPEASDLGVPAATPEA